MTVAVRVVGAGVIGLSCAVRLAEAGLAVDVLARDLPLETTSAAAGALWLPVSTHPLDEVARWARPSLLAFRSLATTEPPDGQTPDAPTPDGQATDGSRGDDRTGSDSRTDRRHRDPGVRLLPGLLRCSAPDRLPAWHASVADLAPAEPVTDVAPGWPHALALTLPVIDMTAYLTFLQERLLSLGGTLTRLCLSALPETGIVVNCTGLAAHALAQDPHVAPIRGQIVVVENPGLTRWWYAGADRDEGPTYLLPHRRRMVLGGTAVAGNWSLAPDRAAAAAIRDRADQLEPGITRSPVLGHRVGLRPVRSRVRLEVERVPSLRDPEHVVVHCYGHGGNGVTLSWGCADEVRDAVLALVS